MTEHKCFQNGRIKRNEKAIDIFHKTMQDIGEIKGLVKGVPAALQRVENRVNGSFQRIDKHIDESPVKERRLSTVETEVKSIKETREGSTRAYQWKTALIVGIICAIPTAIATLFIILTYHKGQ